jgi:hypothetical protein
MSATNPLVDAYLEHVRVEKRLAAHGELYSLDLQKLLENARQGR